jgi:hypothetical protein
MFTIFSTTKVLISEKNLSQKNKIQHLLTLIKKLIHSGSWTQALPSTFFDINFETIFIITTFD